MKLKPRLMRVFIIATLLFGLFGPWSQAAQAIFPQRYVSLYIEDASPGGVLRDNLFGGNYSDTTGNGEGGGLLVNSSVDTVEVAGNRFEDNYATDAGGGMDEFANHFQLPLVMN